jgi:NAD(P)-dependent dehydrogenase (short-subunit alcohol dehydrogenase family)
VAGVRSSIGSRVIGPPAFPAYGVPVVGGSIVFLSGIAATTVRRPWGRTKDIADAIIALLRNGFITGTVLHADGGHRLV